MSDIVEMLRAPLGVFQIAYRLGEAGTLKCHWLVALEAADEIERLRAENERLAAENERLWETVKSADRLREGIRAAGVKRLPELYQEVMYFDNVRDRRARPAPEGK